MERYAGPGHGMVEIDNNRAENAMRGGALGRKNWIQIGSESAGPKGAALLSVLETCKRLKLKARWPRRCLPPNINNGCTLFLCPVTNPA